MADLKVGTVNHYYDKIGVAIIDLTGSLGIGDTIKIVRDEDEFTQKVTSMQIEHEKLETAKKGQVIGIKVDKPVKEKAIVYKIN